MPSSRQKRCDKYRKASDKNSCVASYLLLRFGLNELYGINSLVDFIYNKNGKPYLNGYPNIYFNISHCSQGIVCAIAPKEVGIDIQEFTTWDKDIARRVCSESEISALNISDLPDVLFVKFWTMKESYAKSKGESIATVLKIDIDNQEYFWSRRFEHYYISCVLQKEILPEIALIPLDYGLLTKGFKKCCYNS